MSHSKRHQRQMESSLKQETVSLSDVSRTHLRFNYLVTQKTQSLIAVQKSIVWKQHTHVGQTVSIEFRVHFHFILLRVNQHHSQWRLTWRHTESENEREREEGEEVRE